MSESKGVRVLYMEDDPSQARVAERELERSGYVVDLACDGADGLAKYAQAAYDVLVIDRVMPVCDGLEVLRRLASQGSLPPAIMVTAVGNERNAVEAMKLGASDYLVKDSAGTHLGLLPTVIERALGQHRLAQQKRQAEESLRESEGTLNIILETICDHVSMMDKDLNIIWANGRAKELFGDDMVGKKCYQVYHRREQPCRLGVCSAASALQDGKTHTHDANLVDNAGNVRCFHCTANVALRDKEGNPTAVIKVAKDVTQSKRNEEKLAAYGAYLEKVVEVRTAELGNVNQQLQRDVAERKRVEEKLKQYAHNLELANRHLEEASFMARAASRAKSEFLSNVSHEIRTPLNGIIGFSEVILTSKSLNSACQQARVILGEAEHLLALINDLLDDAKIESGKLELECEPLDLEQVVQSVVSPLHIQVEEKGLELFVLTADDVPRYVLGDAVRLRQVLLNLVSNAVKFTERGSVTVQIDALQHDNHRATLRFAVIDTGIGIPKEKQEAIFESFTQVDGSTTRKYGGTGLGTSIAWKLVRLMGGQIGLKSEPGEGSTFWFTLTVKTCPTRPEPEALALISQSSMTCAQQAPRCTGHILLAEDYPTNQQLARSHLESAGHSLEIAENGVEAVAVCREHRFDLILMDLQMPEMDGYEATRRIRSELPDYAHVPILAMTANASASARKACREAGIDDVITKPIRRGPFLATIDRWLAPSDDEVQPPPSANQEPRQGSDATRPDTPLDYDQAVEGFGGDRALLDAVTDQFLQDVAGRIPLLREAIASEDAEVVRREAHKIHGGAANLTAMPLAAAAERLELLGESGDLAEAPEALDKFEERFQELKRFVSGGDTCNHKSETRAKGSL